MKTVIATVALATLLASPAFAQYGVRGPAYSYRAFAQLQPYNSYYGFGRTTGYAVLTRAAATSAPTRTLAFARCWRVTPQTTDRLSRTGSGTEPTAERS